MLLSAGYSVIVYRLQIYSLILISVMLKIAVWKRFFSFASQLSHTANKGTRRRNLLFPPSRALTQALNPSNSSGDSHQCFTASSEVSPTSKQYPSKGSEPQIYSKLCFPSPIGDCCFLQLLSVIPVFPFCFLRPPTPI